MSSRLAQQTGITTVGDEILIEAYRDRQDASAYSELVRRHQIGVYRLMTGLLVDPDAAEPACEDVFVRAAHRLHELPDPSQLESWLASLARELAQEKDAPAAAHERIPLDATLGPDEGKEAMRGAVREVLASLPPEQRSVLILAELHGEPVEKIARTLGQSPRIVREQLEAARKSFVAELTTRRKKAEAEAAAAAAAKKAAREAVAATRPHLSSDEPLQLAPGYQIRDLLGAGGMGQVFAADQLATGRTVALKLLLPEAAATPGLRERFHREALAMEYVQHPNLVELYERGETTDGGLYLAMERLEGAELFDLLEGGMPPARALHILQHVLAALGQLHARGVIHRDVKPENVFVIERDGDPSFAKLIDLGIARLPPSLVCQQVDTRLTAAGVALGTPAYISPEQAVGYEIDGRADLYAATVMLFEMLTGRLPFDAPDVGAMLAMHVSVTPPRLRDVAPQIADAPAIEPLLDKGLAKNPEDRFDDAAQFIEATQQAAAAVG